MSRVSVSGDHSMRKLEFTFVLPERELLALLANELFEPAVRNVSELEVLSWSVLV